MTSSNPPISRLYSRYFTSEEKRALRLVPIEGVSSEINLVRFLTAHFLKFQQSAPKDLASQMQALRTVALFCEQLAALVRANNRENGPQSEMEAILDEALESLPVFLTDELDELHEVEKS
jgi:hypothetical protein